MPRRRSSGEDPFAEGARRAKAVPHAFVLEALERLDPTTRPMFGCLAAYVGEKIVLVLRDKQPPDADNGVWIATTREHHQSLRRELPSMRSITVFGDGETGWQVLPDRAPTFEEDALRAVALILAADPRIGKIPKPRRVGPKRSTKLAKRGTAATKAKAAKSAAKKAARPR
jgi:hypothetical protein